MSVVPVDVLSCGREDVALIRVGFESDTIVYGKSTLFPVAIRVNINAHAVAS